MTCDCECHFYCRYGGCSVCQCGPQPDSPSLADSGVTPWWADR